MTLLRIPTCASTACWPSKPRCFIVLPADVDGGSGGLVGSRFVTASIYATYRSEIQSWDGTPDSPPVYDTREFKQPRRGKNNVNVARHVCHVRKNGPDFPRMAYHMSLSEAFFRWDPKQTSVGPALPYGEQAMRCVVAGRKERRWGWPRCGADGWKTAGGVGGRPVGWDERDPSRSRRCMMTYCSCFAGGHISNSEGKSDHLGAPQPGRS